MRGETAGHLIGLGLVMGVVHVLTGPDHLSALATLSVGSSLRAFWTGVRWGLGHSTGLLIIAIIFLSLGGEMNLETVGYYCDWIVGVFMILLGVYGWYSADKLVQHLLAERQVLDDQANRERRQQQRDRNSSDKSSSGVRSGRMNGSLREQDDRNDDDDDEDGRQPLSGGRRRPSEDGGDDDEEAGRIGMVPLHTDADSGEEEDDAAAVDTENKKRRSRRRRKRGTQEHHHNHSLTRAHRTITTNGTGNGQGGGSGSGGDVAADDVEHGSAHPSENDDGFAYRNGDAGGAQRIAVVTKPSGNGKQMAVFGAVSTHSSRDAASPSSSPTKLTADTAGASGSASSSAVVLHNGTGAGAGEGYNKGTINSNSVALHINSNGGGGDSVLLGHHDHDHDHDAVGEANPAAAAGTSEQGSEDSIAVATDSEVDRLLVHSHSHCEEDSCLGRYLDMRDSTTQRLVAFGIGIIHGIAGPGGILGVLPAVQMHDWEKSMLYLGCFCFTSTLCMGVFAATYGECTNRVGVDHKTLHRLTLFSASLSVLVGVVWLVLIFLGKLDEVFP